MRGQGFQPNALANGAKLALLAATMICTDVSLRDPEILQLVGEGSTPFLASSLKHILDGLVAGGTGTNLLSCIRILTLRISTLMRVRHFINKGS